MLPGKHSNGQGNVHAFRVNILATRCNATGGTTCEQCQVDWGSLLRRKRRNQRLLICYRVANMAASLFMPEPRSSKLRWWRARQVNAIEERGIGSYYECRRRNVSRHFLAVSNSENLLPSCSTR